MFIIPAIHGSHSRDDDSPRGPLGAMHLNALNGSSNVLGNNESNQGYSGPSSVFGGLFGVSLSDNHPYRPQDCGMTFHETSKTSETCTSTTVSTSSPNAGTKTTSRSKDLLAPLRGSEIPSPTCLRRRSLDLDTVSTNNCCRYDDRSLSLEELAGGPLSRIGRYVGGRIDENDFTSGLDISGLSIREVNVSTGASSDKNLDSLKSQKKRRRALTTDAATSERAMKLLGKIKDSRKEHSNIKHTRLRTEHHEDTEDSSKTGGSRQNVHRHLSDSAHSKQNKDNSRPKDRKILPRSSVD